MHFPAAERYCFLELTAPYLDIEKLYKHTLKFYKRLATDYMDKIAYCMADKVLIISSPAAI